jgi:hypothetical protein
LLLLQQVVVVGEGHGLLHLMHSTPCLGLVWQQLQMQDTAATPHTQRVRVARVKAPTLGVVC